MATPGRCYRYVARPSSGGLAFATATLVRLTLVGFACLLVAAHPAAAEAADRSGTLLAQSESPGASPYQPELTGEEWSTQAIPHPKVTVVMRNRQRFVVELYPEHAPETVANFISLVESGFYDGLGFHRVIPGAIVQGGCPLGNGHGGPGYTIKDEFNNLPVVRGTMAMARGNLPDSSGSQFFIALSWQPNLKGKYSVFGQVIEGMRVVDLIGPNDTMRRVTVQVPPGEE